MTQGQGNNRYRSNPISRLGYKNIKDYYTFKDHLRIPVAYLAELLRANPDGLWGVSTQIPQVVSTVNVRIGRQLMQSVSLAEQGKLLKLRSVGVPALYVGPSRIPDCAEQTQVLFQAMKNNPKKLIDSGKLIYMYSAQQENALLAASEVVKACVPVGKCYMAGFPDLLEDIRVSYKGPCKDMVKKLEAADIACLYMVGCEYRSASGFSDSCLEELVRRRILMGKCTLIVSHLAPPDFKQRYDRDIKSDLGAVTMKFDDPTITNTISKLIKELTN